MAFGLAETTRPQLYRIVHIDKTIKAMRYPNARSLAEELEVHQRTIMRDVGFMKDMLSAPLEYDPKRRGFFYNQADYSLGLLKITEGELLALCLGHNLLVKCKGTPYIQAIVSAFNKICSYVQDTVEIDFGQLTETVFFDLEPLRGDEKQVAAHFATIGAAIKERKTINLLHYSIARNSCRERLVDPYQLRYYQGAWYMVGFCHLRRAVRIFALDRIRELKHTESAFSLHKDFNQDTYFQDSFQLYKGDNTYQVKIWFSPDQARWIREKQLPPTQTIEENPDGSLILTMQTSGLFQVKRWVLSFGAGAKVLAPPELIAMAAHELTAASQLYINT
ncbi:MAG: WYL domain-containing protein [Dethiobacter sp.]|nr:WYL domain-containing protein [Dethiobacter sp.]